MTNRIEHSDKRWYAVRTKFRSEKYVCGLLEAQGVEAYVPVMLRTRRYERKIKTYEIPLISSYVFVRVCNSDYVKVLKTLYVFGFVLVGGRLIAIPEEEMNLMKRITGQEIEYKLRDREPEVGDDVEIIGGSLLGLRAKMISKHNSSELVVELVHIGKQFVLSVDKKYIRKLSRAELAG